MSSARETPAGSGTGLWSWLGTIRGTFGGLTPSEGFEHAVVLVLTALIIVVVGVATWHLALAVLLLVFANQIHPGNQAVFQAIFGMVFTVLIALEFKHSLLIVLARQESVVRLRSVILIAMLAMVRKFILLDLGTSQPAELLALAAAILALGTVYWMVREQDARIARQAPEGERPAGRCPSSKVRVRPGWAACPRPARCRCRRRAYGPPFVSSRRAAAG